MFITSSVCAYGVCVCVHTYECSFMNATVCVRESVFRYAASPSALFEAGSLLFTSALSTWLLRIQLCLSSPCRRLGLQTCTAASSFMWALGIGDWILMRARPELTYPLSQLPDCLCGLRYSGATRAEDLMQIIIHI